MNQIQTTAANYNYTNSVKPDTTNTTSTTNNITSIESLATTELSPSNLDVNTDIDHDNNNIKPNSEPNLGNIESVANISILRAESEVEINNLKHENKIKQLGKTTDIINNKKMVTLRSRSTSAEVRYVIIVFNL